MEKFCFVQRNHQDKITSLHSFLGIKIFEEINHTETEITIKGELAKLEQNQKLQREYIQGFWEYTLLDFIMPKKKFIKEFYISVDTKISSMRFFNWSVSKNNTGHVSHIMIESVIPPHSDFISGYDLMTKLNNNYIYQFDILRLGKIIFSEKPTL